jgi:hypothetical protein
MSEKRDFVKSRGIMFADRTRAFLGISASEFTVAMMLGMIAVPLGLTLHAVRTPAIIKVNSANPTPHGYTISLLLFIWPASIIALWLLPKAQLPRRAFFVTIGCLFPIGASLDFFFAKDFLYFKNPSATLGWNIPTLNGSVPIEEFVFYLAGFTAVLLLYIWCDEEWLRAYRTSDYRAAFHDKSKLVHFHYESLVIGIALIASGMLYKSAFSPTRGGFPGYFTFLVCTAIVPSVAFSSSVRNVINWRAFSLTLFIVLLISMSWEATLAIPYGWWGYQSGEMLGLVVGAWSGLPIEAVIVWLSVTYVTIITFEVCKLWHASGEPARKAFLGHRGATPHGNDLHDPSKDRYPPSTSY